MNKKLMAFGLATALVVAGAASGCSNGTGSGEKAKFGLITLHDSNSTYDANFINAFNAACENKGVKGIIVSDIPEEDACYDAAVNLVEQGCVGVFADSFGHEDFIIKAAKEFPEVQFSHATGVKAAGENLSNYHNAFASIYEGRYLAGVAGGEALKAKLGASYDATATYKLGYVGAYTYAEVISGYTSWFLGVQSVIPNVTMDVKFTGSWYNETAEKNAAEELINSGAVMISQHADSMGAPNACQTAGVLNVSYNGLTGLSTNVASSKIDWTPYFEYMIDCTVNNKAIDTNKTGSITDGSVVVELGSGAASTTAATIEALKGSLNSGAVQVFDCSKYTVGGVNQTTYLADVDGDYKGETEAIKTSGSIVYFSESTHRSAPYFDVRIDGINLLNEIYD